METTGIVISVARQWWLKVNTKSFRTGPMDGATFPYIVKIRYSVEGKEYSIRQWIGAGMPVPREGSSVKLTFDPRKPSRAKICK